MSAQTVLRKLTTIMAADAVGYSRLMGADEQRTVETLTRYRAVTDALISERRGSIIGTAGDSVLAEFPSVVDAVQCAVEIQTAIAARNAALPDDQRLRFRIGVNLGDVIVASDTMHGDGINVAVRLESIAEPETVCISRAVYDQVFNKLSYAFRDLGARKLKNIAYSVQVFRVDKAAPNEAGAPAPRATTALSQPVPGFHGRPALAVLPFVNHSGPDEEYFADGITEDIIAELANWRVFPVIARNSSFNYKGTSVGIQQVASELGVRYAVEGSVRKSGRRVRVLAQLVDATTGHQVLAQKYDREQADIFELQDEIVGAVVGAIEPELLKIERERATHASAQELSSYDFFMRGLAHHYRYTKEDSAEAQRLFRKAIEIDSNNVNAHAHLALAMLFGVRSGWRLDDKHNYRLACELAQHAVALDGRDPNARFALCTCHMFEGRVEESLIEVREAIRLNPSLAAANITLSFLLNYTGHPQEALAAAEKAFRLSPIEPRLPLWLPALAGAHYHLGHHEEAIRAARRALALRPGYAVALRYVVAALGQLGRTQEARHELAALMAQYPTMAELRDGIGWVYRDPATLEFILDGLRKAGMT